MKYVFLAALILVLSVLQTTLIDYISILGVVPNLLLVSSICYCLIRGDFKSIIFGSIVGAVLDLLSGHMVGMNMILCTLCALLSANLYESLFNNNSFVAAVFVLWISALFEFLVYAFYFLFWKEGEFVFALVHRILPFGVYNAAIAFIIYPIMRKISSFDTAERD